MCLFLLSFNIKISFNLCVKIIIFQKYHLLKFGHLKNYK